MPRRVLVCAALALVFASPAAAARSWALPQIKLVTAKGLMGGTASGFRPDDPLSQGDLAELVAGLTGKEAPVAANPSAPATIGQLDAQLVRARGLLPGARPRLRRLGGGLDGEACSDVPASGRGRPPARPAPDRDLSRRLPL